jgi:folate-binding Fe-S cluster repair protein YgfZ
VVSRVEHRGTARKRVVPVTFEDFGPEAGVAVKVGEMEVGTMGSSARGRGLAMLHLGRIGDALAADKPITSGGVTLHPAKPAWARFDWPGEAKAAESVS